MNRISDADLERLCAFARSVLSNTPDNARLIFDHVVNDRLQDLVETSFEFYKRVTDTPAFAKYFPDWVFERVRKRVAAPDS